MMRINKTNYVKLGLTSALGILVVAALASASLVFAQMDETPNTAGNYGVSLTCDASLATSEINLVPLGLLPSDEEAELTEAERLELVNNTLGVIDLDALPSDIDVDEFKARLFERSGLTDVPYTRPPRSSTRDTVEKVQEFSFYVVIDEEGETGEELIFGKEGYVVRGVEDTTVTLRITGLDDGAYVKLPPINFGDIILPLELKLVDRVDDEVYGLPNLPYTIRRAFDCVRTLDDDDRRALAEVLVGQDYYSIVAMQLGVSEEEVRNALNGLADDLRGTTYDYPASELSRNLAEVAADLGVTRITLLGALSESVLLLGESRKDAGELETLKLTFARLSATGLISSDDVDAINQWLDEWVAGIPESELADGIRDGFNLGRSDGFDLFGFLGLDAYYD